MKKSFLLSFTAASFLLAPGSARTQDVLEFTEIRRIPHFGPSLGLLRLGYNFTFPDSKDKERYKEGDSFPDISFCYMSDKIFDKNANFVFYGGREGVYFATGQMGAFDLKSFTTRLEAWYGPWSFYREGFYRGDKFIPTLMYEGREYRARLGFYFPVMARGRMFAELSGFWGRNSFKRNSQTLGPSDLYTIPDDYQVAGARLTIEAGQVHYNRYSGYPDGGGLVTIWGERETNDSSEHIGTPAWKEKLPSQVWRVGGRATYYYPLADNQIIEISGFGRLFDERDRVMIYDASKPIGERFLLGHVGYRYHITEGMLVMPYLLGEYVKIAGEAGGDKKEKFFFGGGLEFRYAIGKKISLYLEYSYLSNESREPVGISKDRFAEHRLSAGMEVTFGGR